MPSIMRRNIAALTAFLIFAAPGGGVAEEQRPIFIGAASPTGVYHAVGGAVCRQINKSRRKHGVYCFVETTNGSIDNLQALRAGEFEFGVVQSDWQSRAYHGTGIFEDYGPFKNLRAVFAVHSESFILLARKDAGIKSFADLRGKRVNVGPAGSAGRATMDILIDAFGFSASDFTLSFGAHGHHVARALCNGRLDAIVYFLGHPNEDVDSATALCGAVLVEISGDPVTKLMEDNPFYREAVIPGGLYPGNPVDVKTFGAVATVVTVAETPDDVVRKMVRAVFNNIESFRELHPAFVLLEKQDMAAAEMGAPLHPAAADYYKNEGMW